MGNRGIVAVCCALLGMALLAAPAQAAFPGKNGKIVVSLNGDLYTFNPDGSGLTNVTNSGGSLGAGSPEWSSDGTKIVFSSGGDIWLTNADGSGITNLTQDPDGNDFWPSWSPDGTKIAFTTDRRVGFGYEIYAMNSSGTNQTNLTNNNYFWDAAPAWSPNGTRIAFETEREQDNFSGAIWAMDPDGGNPTDLSQNPDFNGYLEPNWSPSGGRIAMASANVNTPGLFIMNADGTNPAPLPNTSGDRDPAWSPDGQKIVFEDPGGIATINPDGTGKSVLGPGSDPDWQPIPTGYPRPKGATPLRVPLVISYKNCTTPNEQHGPPLAYPSCSPPLQQSDWVTTGTSDTTGQATQFVGSLRFDTIVGDPATTADEADVTAVMSITDVRNKSDLTDYTGRVQANLVLRMTDRFNAVAPGGGDDAATVVDIPLPVDASCAATADPAVGSTCAVSTSMDAFVPGMVPEHRRMVWQMGAIEIYDGGSDGNPATAPNTVFARQGVFVP